MGLLRILTDDSEDELRRTPRRVRFGGEVVKMRTPDSDSNHPSDMENDVTMVVKPWDDKSDQASIQIRCSEVTSKRSPASQKQLRSGIPVPRLEKTKSIRSEPTSPVKQTDVSLDLKKGQSRSSPNLSVHRLGDDLVGGASRIPRRSVSRLKANIVQGTTIRIDINDAKAPKVKIQAVQAIEEAEAPEILDSKKSTTPEEREKPKLSERRGSRHLSALKIEPRTRRDSFSPIPVHKEIEIFHNLTRSPDRSKSEEDLVQENTALVLPPIKTSSSPRNISSAVSACAIQSSKSARKLSSANATPNFNPTLALVPYGSVHQTPTIPPISHDGGEARMRYSSFHVYKDTNENSSKSLKATSDSPIPTNDRGECLTCSSSGSDSHAFDSNWDDVDVIDSNIIKHLQNKVSQ